MPNERDGTDQVDLLKAARERLSADERKIARRIIAQFELDLLDALPELIAGVRASGKQSSFSETVALKPAKKQNLHISLAPRVRAAREVVEFEAHIDDSNQLALGWVEAEDEPEDEDEDGEIGRNRPVGFDDALDDGAFH
jgi:hypothetical protein